MMVEMLLVFFSFTSWLYWLIAWYLTRTFFRSFTQAPQDYKPSVSILKPLKGVDAEAYENFVSFCLQDYPDFELLFGVSNLQDPLIPVVTRLQQAFPDRSIRLFTVQTSMPNRKVGVLHHLATCARNEILVINDSDMRVTPDYLQRVVAPLANQEVGLVTCTYRGARPLTWAARLEALHMGATFLPSVLVARSFLRMRFALGATLALRRRDLARLGGFAAIGEYLADDYQLGVRIARLGLRVHLSDYVVTSILGATTFREQWYREIRWARTHRVCHPLEYPGLILTFSTPLALALLLMTYFTPLGFGVLSLSLLVRWFVAWRVSHYTGDQVVRKCLHWLPLRDVLSALIWGIGMVGRRIVWRGEEFILQPDGRLQFPVPGLSIYSRARSIMSRGQ